MSLPCTFDFTSLVSLHTFTVSPSTIAPLEQATLSWRVEYTTGSATFDNATITLDLAGERVDAAGSTTVAPLVTTTYRLVAGVTGVDCQVVPWTLGELTVTVDLSRRWQGEIKHLAVNGTKLGQGGVYGDNLAQLRDVDALRADSLRQPGELDLTWSLLARDHSAVVPAGSKPPYFPIPIADADLRALVLGTGSATTNVERFRSLFTHLVAHDLRVRLTFLTIGGGGELVTGGADGVNSAPALDWASDHLGHTVEVDGETATLADSTDPQVDAWSLGTLDPRSTYQRLYVQRIAAAVGELLVSAETEVRRRHPGFVLVDAIARIELFNEIDATGQRTDGTSYHVDQSADDWARMVGAAGTALRSALAAGVGPPPELALPGLSSYSDDTSGPHAWSYRRAFVSAFLTALAGHAPTLVRHLRSADYHWYHTGAGGAGELHVAHLWYEAAWLRSELDARGFTATNLTVLENGASALLDGRADPSEELRQARQVWRRVGCALASYVRAAGWHAWMSADGNYAGFGLRADARTGAAATSSASSTRRPSWYAYHRLARYLGAVRQGHLLAPTPPSRSDLASAAPADHLTIFGYELRRSHAGAAPSGDRYRFAYLLFVDDVSADAAPQTATATATYHAELHQLATVPTSWTASTVASGELPRGAATWTAPIDTALAAGASVSYGLTRTDAPILILATHALVWAVTGASW